MKDGGKTRINTEETMLAEQKRKELQTRLGEWIWEDNERTKELAALYNKLYNGVVPSRPSMAIISPFQVWMPSGSSISIPGSEILLPDDQ